MKYVQVALMAIFLFACNDQSAKKQETGSDIDQCLRREIFVECMQNIPKGPIESYSNDWDEVISECAEFARRSSFRKLEYIKQECRSK